MRFSRGLLTISILVGALGIFAPASGAPCTTGCPPPCPPPTTNALIVNNSFVPGPLTYYGFETRNACRVGVAAEASDPLTNSQSLPSGDWLSFFDLDLVRHTVTDKRCIDDPAVVCAFDVNVDPAATNPGSYFVGANVLKVGGSFAIGQTYAFACRIHPQMVGSFTVHSASS